MRAIRVASAALLGMTALTLAAPVAAAGDVGVTAFRFNVVPSTIAAGGQVTLQVDRSNGDCTGKVIVSSGVFDTVSIKPSQSSRTATVDWDAKPGAVYDVKFTCDGNTASVGLTIAGGRVNPTTPPYPYPYPDRGVHAGEGGTIGGFDLKEIGLGAALIAGSVGAAYHFSRRRTGEDGA
ncbi:hypothetical protein ACIPSE_27205 [Streptomyces sp. NPDC090106]|uniref:hypothetical protein n=1 Tax=Streptomyces sp. NPDC090106 TaxID=3365946 RepID=UPI00382E3F24